MNPAWLTSGARLLQLLIGAVHATEAVVCAFRGQDKQDQAIVSLRAMLDTVEIGLDPALRDDPAIEHAERALMSDYVALQNLIAEKTAERALGRRG
jgi:hypothetical protein